MPVKLKKRDLQGLPPHIIERLRQVAGPKPKKGPTVGDQLPPHVLAFVEGALGRKLPVSKKKKTAAQKARERLKTLAGDDDIFGGI